MILFLIIGLLITFFGFVVLFGAPYLPTRQAQAKAALDLLDLKPGQIFYDLGCGDGRVLKLAAKQGTLAVGYELNPVLAATAIIINWPYRNRVKVKIGNFWQADLKDADGIFVFLLDKYMPKLDQKLSRQGRSLKLATYAFKIKGKKPAGKNGPVYLYEY